MYFALSLLEVQVNGQLQRLGLDVEIGALTPHFEAAETLTLNRMGAAESLLTEESTGFRGGRVA